MRRFSAWRLATVFAVSAAITMGVCAIPILYLVLAVWIGILTIHIPLDTGLDWKVFVPGYLYGIVVGFGLILIGCFPPRLTAVEAGGTRSGLTLRKLMSALVALGLTLGMMRGLWGGGYSPLAVMIAASDGVVLIHRLFEIG